ncbi:MAG: hypothetical protein MUE53_09230, partial [Chitinophagales bacterium]|nr:hypothetical protein [Chitinophagales bacterium]
MTRYLFFLILFGISSKLKAQKEIEPIEIDIIKEFNVKIDQGIKQIYALPQEYSIGEDQVAPVMKLNLPDKIKAFSFSPKPLNYQAFSNAKETYNSDNFLKLGIGSLINPYLEWNHNHISDKKQQWNINVFHNSFFRETQTQQSNKYSSLNAYYAKVIQNDFNLKPAIDIHHYDYNFFGNLKLPNAYMGAANRLTLNIAPSLSFDNANAQNSFLSIETKAKFGYQYEQLNIDKAYQNNEYHYSGFLNLGKKFTDALLVNLITQGLVAQTNHQAQNHRFIASLMPHFQYKKKGFLIKLAADFSLTRQNTEGNFYVLPKLETEVNLFKDYLIFYSYWKRTLDANLAQDLITQNEFMVLHADSIPISRIETRKAGFKGNIQSFVFNASFQQQIIKDKLLWANDASSPRFLLGVVEKNMTITNLSVDLAYEYQKLLRFQLKN